MRDKLRRVVVRGVGMVSCLGISAPVNWTRLLRGDCGLQKLKVEGLVGPCKIGGQVNADDLEEAWKSVKEHQQCLRGLEKQLDRGAMSRAGLLGILAAREALDQAGWYNQSDRDFSQAYEISCRTGSYFSAGLDGVQEIIQSSERMARRGFAGMGAHTLTRSLANMPVGHISRAWGLRGPTMACNTACASGLHSIGEAFRMIQHGEADRMIAGGCEATVDAWSIAAFARIRALATGHNDTPQLASRPFDSDREGFVMSEGAGAILLEVWPPSHSSASSLPPIAEILGFGRSADAFGLVAPELNGDGACRSMEAAVKDAGLTSLNDISHINCHATSTPLGDVIELAAIAKLLTRFPKLSDTPRILVNSIKGHLGHCLGAAGGIETAYSVLSVHHGRVVGNRNLIKPPTPQQMTQVLEKSGENNSEAIDRLFEQTRLPTEVACDMPQYGKRRMVLTNSFGFGGTNGSLLIANWIE